MRKRIAAALLTSGAAALTIGLGATQAVAATWTVSPGGNITGTAGTTTLKDTTTNNTLTCTSSSSAGSVKTGTGLAGSKLGKITSQTFSNCSGPAGLTFTVTTTASTTNPWNLNAASYNSTTGVTSGSITNIMATLSGPGCSATVAGTTATTTGTVKVSYTNSTHKLKTKTTGGTLHIWNVSGCFGLINSGDASVFTGTYAISPGQTITSP